MIDPFVAAYSREYPKREVAVLVLISPAEEVLLARTTRLPNHWQPLGGGIDPDDLSPAHAVAREVKEEVGVDASPDDLAHLCDVPYDFGTGTVHSYAMRLQGDISLLVDWGEIAEVRWLPLGAAFSLPMFPATAKTLRALAARGDLIRADVI